MKKIYPTKKRIMLMKTNENVKSTMDKFKEYTKSGESSAKSLQY